MIPRYIKKEILGSLLKPNTVIGIFGARLEEMPALTSFRRNGLNISFY